MKRVLVPIFLFCLVLIGCDSSLHKVSKGLDATATAIGTLQTTAISGFSSGLLDKPTTDIIINLCVKVNQAGKEAVAITRAISQLDQLDSTKILAILKPIISAVGDIVDNGLVGIKDEVLKTKIKGILVGIQTSLNAVQLTLNGG